MIDDPTQDLTLRQILLGDDDERDLPSAAEGVGVTRLIDDALIEIPPGLRAAARDQVLTLVAEALDQRLVDLMIMGWRTWGRIEEAARRSLETPGATDLAELVDHEVTSSHHPRIEVRFDGRTIAEIQIDLEAAIVLHALTAVLSRGRLTAICSGRADVTAQLAVLGQTVMTANRSIELPIKLPLGEGIELVPPPRVVTLPAAEEENLEPRA